ncbi:MMPL family transporter [Halobacteria archaeon AArc-m2/3/4]|uniref:MMPL family transporter n=1 Tax=Natronoglomus mannanivorans TaxID=2979990 RepID=A0ABT2QEV7_9EURY|nr:MMPL family transporter [Halobacteria archaeon AArc-m2/3/4]
MTWIDSVATFVTDHSRVLIVVMLLVTAGLAPGLAQIEDTAAVGGLSDDSPVAEANAEIQDRFTDREENTTTAVIAVSSDEENVLSREALVRTLEYQRALHDNRTVEETFVADDPVFGIENLVARAAIAADRRGQLDGATIAGWNETEGLVDANVSRDEWESPSLDEQIEHLESTNDSEVAEIVEEILDPDSNSEATRVAYQLLPESYEPGSSAADGRLMILTQETDSQISAAAEISENVSSAQAISRSIAAEQPDNESYAVYGRGMVNYEQDIVMEDSFTTLGPLALAFVLIALSLAYRDPTDVLLGLVGIVATLVWTMGTMGWLAIAFNPVMIAVPILLIGLSVDFALHVIMRYREERHRLDDGVRPAMTRSIVRVGPALGLVTVTTIVGFLSNYTSPLGDLQDFGVVTAIGIVFTLLVFGVFVPALKCELASLLDGRGWDRTPSLPGADGRVRRLLEGGAVIASRAPVVLLVVALLVTAGGAYGATHLEMSAEQELFMGDNPPEWVENVPDALEPSEYALKDDRAYIYSTFQSPDRQGFVFVEGNVTAPGTLERVDDAERTAARSDAVYESPTGEPEIVTPLSEMRAVAEEDPAFNDTFAAADTSGDAIPDRDLETVYDAFYEAAPDRAAESLDRTDGGYTAMQLRIATDGAADRSEAVGPVFDAAGAIDGADDLRAVGTGESVVEEELNDRLSTTLIESLTITIVVILSILAIVFRVTKGSATLGALTLVPVVLSVTWLFGTMALLGIPISLITAMVGSITVGIGIDYAIHVSERYWQEREGGADATAALRRTVLGTGSALMSSAVTTAIGFGVLAFSLLPALRHFGFVLALGIVYSFLATVYLQPSLLAVWDRYAPGSVVATASAAVPDDD